MVVPGSKFIISRRTWKKERRNIYQLNEIVINIAVSEKTNRRQVSLFVITLKFKFHNIDVISLGVTIWDHRTFSYRPSCSRFSFDRTSWRIPVVLVWRNHLNAQMRLWKGAVGMDGWPAWTYHPRTRTCWGRVASAADLSQKSGGVCPSPWLPPCKSLQERHLLGSSDNNRKPCLSITPDSISPNYQNGHTCFLI